MKQVLELFTTFLAVGVGLALFRKLDRFHRLIFFQVTIFLLLDLFSLTLDNNNWLYNIQIPIETALLFSAALTYFESTGSKRVLLILFTVFLIVYILDIIYFTGIMSFAYHAAIAEGFLITLVYTILLYVHLMNKKTGSANAALIMASIGMIIYFACTIPYLCVMFYFQGLDPVGNDRIFVYIIVSMASLRYLFIAIAFFINGRKQQALRTG